MGDNPDLAKFLKTKFLVPPSTLPYNLSKETVKTVKHTKYLNNNIFYKFIRQTFQNSPPGFFIEAGAFDGQLASNTLWLEMRRNWTGLLIEASPVNCKNLKLKNRKTWVSCSCITPKPYSVTSVFETPTEHNFVTDVHLFRSNFRSLESRFHTYNDIILKSSSFTYNRVQCFPLISYLNALNVTTVDVLSLDIQGGEKSIVLSLPFNKIKVKYLLIEYYKRGPNPTEADLDFIFRMKQNNFKLANISESTGEYIFVLNN